MFKSIYKGLYNNPYTRGKWWFCTYLHNIIFTLKYDLIYLKIYMFKAIYAPSGAYAEAYPRAYTRERMMILR